MKKRVKIIILIAAIILLISILFLFTCQRKSNIIEKNANINEITQEKGKVNVYIFWGDGCAHCKKAFDYFEELSKKYGDKFNVYGFESWFNEKNNDLKDKFAKTMNDEPKGVPYIIIGNYTFNGFNDTKNEKKKILKAIKKSSSKNKDIYFDKIKD